MMGTCTRSAGDASRAARPGEQTGKTTCGKSRSTVVPGQPPGPSRRQRSTSPRPGSTSPTLASSRTFTSGCAAWKPGSRQISQRAAKTGATDTVSTSSRTPSASATACDSREKLAVSCAQNSSARGVTRIPFEPRSKSAKAQRRLGRWRPAD